MENLGISDQIVRFSSDPYHASQYSSVLAFLALDGSNNAPSVSISKFWDCVKDPKIVINKRMLLNGKHTNNSGSSPSSNQSNLNMPRSTSSSSISSNLNPLLDASKRQISSSSSIRKLVSDIIVGPEYGTSPNAVNHTHFTGSIMFHPGIKDTVIVSTESSIHYLNVHFMTILNTFSMDKHQGAGPIVQIIPTKSRPCLFTLHENGTLFLRKYQVSGEHTMTVQLETICHNDNPRFSNKKTEVIGCAVHPIDENAVIIYLNDGRLLKYELVDMKSAPVLVDLKPHLTTPSTPYVPSLGFEPSQTRDALGSHNNKLGVSTNKQYPTLSNAVKQILDLETDASLSMQLKRG